MASALAGVLNRANAASGSITCWFALFACNCSLVFVNRRMAHVHPTTNMLTVRPKVSLGLIGFYLLLYAHHPLQLIRDLQPLLTCCCSAAWFNRFSQQTLALDLHSPCACALGGSAARRRAGWWSFARQCRVKCWCSWRRSMWKSRW